MRLIWRPAWPASLPAMQDFQQRRLVGIEPLERLAFDAWNNRRNEPLRLAHLDHGDDGAILLEGSEGPARVKRLRHGALRRLLLNSAEGAITLAARPIASAHLRTWPVIGSGLNQAHAAAAIPERRASGRRGGAPGQSLRALGRHLVFNQADDASDNRAGNATPDRLAGESTDVDIVARPGHHRNERTKELTTTDAADCTSNRVAKRAQTNVLRCCARCIAANCTSNKLNDKIDDRSRYERLPCPRVFDRHAAPDSHNAPVNIYRIAFLRDTCDPPGRLAGFFAISAAVQPDGPQEIYAAPMTASG